MKEENLSPKVISLFKAVGELIEEGADINVIKVSDITQRAGIGKGTAYEYFSNKEEIISCAMLYQVNAICMQIERQIDRLNRFSAIIEFILECMDQEIKKRDCFLKYIHIISDNGMISKILKKKIETRDNTICMPDDLLYKIIEIGIKKGEIKDILPLDYMCMTIGAKLLVYAIYLAEGMKEGKTDSGQMHELICSSLIKEFN